MYKLTKYEMETVINFNDAEKIAYVSSSQKRIKEQLKKLAEEHPDEVKITHEDLYTVIATMPKYYIKMKPKRFISEEQKLAAAKRLAEYRAKKANNELLSENELADFEELEDDEKSLILDED
jgi:hypothetical protein